MYESKWVSHYFVAKIQQTFMKNELKWSSYYFVAKLQIFIKRIWIKTNKLLFCYWHTTNNYVHEWIKLKQSYFCCWDTTNIYEKWIKMKKL